MKQIILKITKAFLAIFVGLATLTTAPFALSVKVEAEEISAVEKEASYTQYVDPFVCTDVDYGQLFPGPVVPNGLVKLSPDTYPHNTLDHAGYDYSKLQIQGFSHTRIEGVGGQGAGGDVLVTPTYVQYTQRPSSASKAMSYTKEQESAKPGYYSVELTPNVGSDDSISAAEGKIKAELTTDQRTGYHRYTFPTEGTVNIITDLNYTYHGTDIRDAILDVLVEDETTTAIGGRFSGKNVSGYGKYTMYFYMETSKPTTSVKTWNEKELSDVKSQAGNDLGAILSFDVAANETIEIKVSISPISVEQAKIDMYNEVPGWDFDSVYTKADAAWNNILSKVRVESSETSDPTGELKKLFYTHLYHMFMTPVNATSTTGIYRGTDGKIYEANDYTHYDSWTLWDDYRKYAMIGLVEPDTYKDMIQSIADALNTGIATWSHNLQPVPNVRTEHAISLLADGIAKGYFDIDGLEGAYEAAKKIANNAITSSVEAQGYFTTRVDKTAEYAYDDWCLSIVAAALGLEEESNYFLERSMNYKNTYRSDAVDSPFSDNKLGLLWNKKADGSWSSSSPTKIGADSLYQGSMWQYTWYDSNDINGLMELMGGEQMMLEALMYMFGMQDTSDGSLYLHNAANEVELGLPYFFNYVGRADLTQYWIRKIYTGVSYNTGYASGNVEAQMYKLSPQGYLETMDDDAGTMAMMFVSSAMGIYPMTPGDTAFQIGTPFFDKVTLDVGNGKALTIVADGVSSENYYIQSATFNGERFDRTWIDYSEITNGGVLYFKMGNTPSDWGKGSVTAPSSSDYAPTSYSDDDVIQYSTGTFEEADSNDGTITDTIEISVANTTFTGNVEDDLVALGHVSVDNVPAGLTAKAIKKDDTTIVLSFVGKANKHTTNDSVSNVVVSIEDSAVADQDVIKDSIRKSKNNVRITFSNDALAYSSYKLSESIKEVGTIEGSVTISLNGTTTFTGSVNEDFVTTGKVALSNVPDGLTPSIIKKDDKTLELSFNGYAYNEDFDVNVSIGFDNSAFNNTSTSEIKNASLTGMNAFVLDFFKDYTDALKDKIADAEDVDKDDYSTTTYEALMSSVEEAKALLENTSASEDELKAMITELIYKMESLSLKVVKDGSLRFEAEKPDALSNEVNPYNKGALKLESVNLGNTFDGAWIAYYNVDFSLKEFESIEVRYSGSKNCIADARLEVRLDGLDGELVASVDMPPTGAWSSWNVVSSEIDSTLLEGVHDLYFVCKGSTNNVDKYYIANIDYMQFMEKEEVVLEKADEYKIEFEKDQSSGGSNWSGGSLKTESSTDSDSNSLVNIGGTVPNAWLKYNDVNFDTFESDEIVVRYVNNSGRCKPDATLHFYLDSMDNDPFVSVAIPATGSNWKNYVEVSASINKELSGTHNVYVKMTGSQGSNPYIANLDWFEFNKVEESTESDLTQLNAVVAEAKAFVGLAELYEVEGISRLEYLLENAEQIDEESEQDEIDELTGSITMGISLLVYRVLNDLPQLIEKVEALDPADYTIVSYEQLATPLSEAKETISKAFDLEAYQQAYDTLKEAVDALVKVANKTKLSNVLSEASLLAEEEYTPNSWAALITAIEAGNALMDDEQAIQTQVDAGVKTLKEALNALLKRADKSELSSLIDALEELLSEDYTQASWEALLEELEEAKVVENDNNATVNDVTSAIEDLKDVQDSLVNVKELISIIEKVEDTDVSEYTEESIATLMDALSKAKEVLVDGSNEEVKEAKEALIEAYEGLTNKKESIDKEDPDTGDNTNVNLLIAMMLAALACILVVSRKRKNI